MLLGPTAATAPSPCSMRPAGSASCSCSADRAPSSPSSRRCSAATAPSRAHAAERALSEVEADAGRSCSVRSRAGARGVLCADRRQPLQRRGDDGPDRPRRHRCASMPVVVAGYRLDALERGGEVLDRHPASRRSSAMRKPLSQAPAEGRAAARSRLGPAHPQGAHARRRDAHRHPRRAAGPARRGLRPRGRADRRARGDAAKRACASNATASALIWCDLGKSNGVYTLRVDSFVDREQEFMDDILAA